jgi:hypothetical protein
MEHADFVYTEGSGSQIARLGYNPNTQVLHIHFVKGGIYSYENVSPEEWIQFKDSESMGSHFHSHIKGKFPSTKIS